MLQHGRDTRYVPTGLEYSRGCQLEIDRKPEGQSRGYGMISLQTVSLFVFVALRPMSTAMVIAGRSVHLTTLFPGQA